MVTFIRAKDYDKIKNGEDVEIVVEAKNREPMKVFVSNLSFSTNKSDDANYENAVFNGERWLKMIDIGSKDQMSVGSLKKLLDKLSDNGCDDMTIYLGDDTPLLEDAISLDYINKQLLLRNTYYDKTMVDAAREFKNAIDSAITDYIYKCYNAGRFIKCGEDNIL